MGERTLLRKAIDAMRGTDVSGCDDDDEDEGDRYDSLKITENSLQTSGLEMKSDAMGETLRGTGESEWRQRERRRRIREMKMEIEALRRNYQQLNNDDEHERILEALAVLSNASESSIAEVLEYENGGEFEDVCDLLRHGEVVQADFMDNMGGIYDVRLEVRVGKPMVNRSSPW